MANKLIALLLLNAAIPLTALASGTDQPSAIVAYAIHGKGSGRVLTIALAHKIYKPTACNTSGTYTVDLHTANGVYLASILLNLRNHTFPFSDGQLAAVAYGKRTCQLYPGSEDAAVVNVTDHGDVAFTYTAPYALDPDIYPIVSNMAHRSSTSDYSVVTGYYTDLCIKKLSENTVNVTWGSPGFGSKTTPPADSTFFNTVGADVRKMVNGISRFGNCYLMGNPVEGVSFNAEQIENGFATIIWRNNGGKFHGAILHKEKDGHWKLFVV